MFGAASGSRAKKTTHLLCCQRPSPRKPGEHVCSTLAFASSAREEKQGRPASFGREEQAQAERRGVAQTQRPRHVAGDFNAATANSPWRTLPPLRPDCGGRDGLQPGHGPEAVENQDSIGGRGGARQSGLTTEPALAFFGQDALRKWRPAADAVTVGRGFPTAALLGAPRDQKRRGRLPDAGGTKQATAEILRPTQADRPRPGSGSQAATARVTGVCRPYPTGRPSSSSGAHGTKDNTGACQSGLPHRSAAPASSLVLRGRIGGRPARSPPIAS